MWWVSPSVASRSCLRLTQVYEVCKWAVSQNMMVEGEKKCSVGGEVFQEVPDARPLSVVQQHLLSGCPGSSRWVLQQAGQTWEESPVFMSEGCFLEACRR